MYTSLDIKIDFASSFQHFCKRNLPLRTPCRVSERVRLRVFQPSLIPRAFRNSFSMATPLIRLYQVKWQLTTFINPAFEMAEKKTRIFMRYEYWAGYLYTEVVMRCTLKSALIVIYRFITRFWNTFFAFLNI